MRSFLRCSRSDLEPDFKLLHPRKSGFETPFQLTTALIITFLVNFLPSWNKWLRLILSDLFFFRYIRYYLFHEKIISFTPVSSDPSVAVKLELVSEEKGTCNQLNQPDGIRYQWFLKGSYRLEQMLRTIFNPANPHHNFTSKNYCIYVLDKYCVHIMPVR